MLIAFPPPHHIDKFPRNTRILTSCSLEHPSPSPGTNIIPRPTHHQKTLLTVATYLEAVVGPRAEFHDTRLLVEREILDVYLAGGLVYGRGLPLHPPREVEGGFGGQGHLEVTVGAETHPVIDMKMFLRPEALAPGAFIFSRLEEERAIRTIF